MSGGWTGVFFRVRARWLLVFAFVGLVFLLAVSWIGLGADTESDTDAALAALLYVPLLAWVWFLMWRNQLRLAPFFALPRIGRYWWTVLGMTVALFVFSIGASALTSLIFPILADSAPISTDGNPIVLFLSLVVAPPFVEELIFRGVLLERWAVKWRIGVAVVVQAICFGVLHADPVGAGVFGVCMALLYLRTKTLLVPMAMHALNNGIVFAAVVSGAGAGGSEAATGAETLVTGVLMLAVSTPFVVLFIRRNWRGADTLTPYEIYEKGPGSLPPRRLAGVTVTGRPNEQYRWLLSPTALMVTRDRRGDDIAWRLPYAAVTHLGATTDFRRVSVACNDGSVLTLTPRPRSERARERCIAALQRRVPQADLLQLTS